jgi:MFS family permease
MVFLIGTFGLNFPIFISTMSVSVFHKGAGEFGLLSSIMAIGSVVGALLSARRERPRVALLFAGAAFFGAGCAIAALMPNYWLFAVALVAVGISSQTLMTTANGVVQMTTEPKLRGRVMAIYMAIFMGGTPIGAPVVGWVADAFGPRWALGVAAASGFAAALVGVFYLVKYRNLRVEFRSWRLRFVLGDREDVEEALGAGEAAAQRA